MASNVLASLRVYAKERNVSYKASPCFRNAVNAVMDLRLFEGQRAHVDDPTELEIERRSTDLRRSVRLQKLLEVDLRMDHKKSLKDAAQEAVSAGRVRPECVDVAVGANSARHRKWVKSQRWRPKQIVIEQRTLTHGALTRSSHEVFLLL